MSYSYGGSKKRQQSARPSDGQATDVLGFLRAKPADDGPPKSSGGPPRITPGVSNAPPGVSSRSSARGDGGGGGGVDAMSFLLAGKKVEAEPARPPERQTAGGARGGGGGGVDAMSFLLAGGSSKKEEPPGLAHTSSGEKGQASGFLAYTDEEMCNRPQRDGSMTAAWGQGTGGEDRKGKKQGSRKKDFLGQAGKWAAKSSGSLSSGDRTERSERSASVVSIGADGEPYFGEEDDFDPDIKYSQELVKGRPIKVIKAATVERLVDALASEADAAFRNSFLMTYRAFLIPEELLDKLLMRYQPGTSNLDTEGTKQRVRVVGVLKAWIEQFFYDFSEQSMEDALVKFLDQMRKTMASSAERLQKTYKKHKDIYNGVGGGEDEGKANSKFKRFLPSEPTSSEALEALKTGWVIEGEKLIAEQMTIIESEMYCSILPKECLAWNKKEKEILSPNISRMIKQFNEVSSWVRMTMVTIIRKEKRIEMLKKFIRVMEELFHLNNFNGMMEILSGLNSASVRRMKSAFSSIGDDYTSRLETIEEVLSHKFSYRAYREHLHTITPPCIPYMGVYLTDLTFVLDGNPDKVEDDLINFFKWRKVADIITEIKQYQLDYTALNPVTNLSVFFRSLDFSLSEDDCYVWSTKVEPKNPELQVGKLIAEEEVLLEKFRILQAREARLSAYLASLRALRSTTHFVCLWGFRSKNQKEISTEAGEVLELVKKISDEWSLMRNFLGKEGLVPRNYIRAVPCREGIAPCVPSTSVRAPPPPPPVVPRRKEKGGEKTEDGGGGGSGAGSGSGSGSGIRKPPPMPTSMPSRNPNSSSPKTEPAGSPKHSPKTSAKTPTSPKSKVRQLASTKHAANWSSSSALLSMRPSSGKKDADKSKKEKEDPLSLGGGGGGGATSLLGALSSTAAKSSGDVGGSKGRPTRSPSFTSPREAKVSGSSGSGSGSAINPGGARGGFSYSPPPGAARTPTATAPSTQPLPPSKYGNRPGEKPSLSTSASFSSLPVGGEANVNPNSARPTTARPASSCRPPAARSTSPGPSSGSRTPPPTAPRGTSTPPQNQPGTAPAPPSRPPRGTTTSRSPDNAPPTQKRVLPQTPPTNSRSGPLPTPGGPPPSRGTLPVPPSQNSAQQAPSSPARGSPRNMTMIGARPTRSGDDSSTNVTSNKPATTSRLMNSDQSGEGSWKRTPSYLNK